MCPDLAHIRPEDTFPVSSAAKYLKSGVMEHGKFELRPNLSLHSLQNTAWLQYTKSYIFRYPSRFGLDSSIHLPKQCLSEGNKNINLRKYKSLNLTVCHLDQLHLHWPSMCHGHGLEGCSVCWKLGKREGGSKLWLFFSISNFIFSFPVRKTDRLKKNLCHLHSPRTCTRVISKHLPQLTILTKISLFIIIGLYIFKFTLIVLVQWVVVKLKRIEC